LKQNHRTLHAASQRNTDSQSSGIEKGKGYADEPVGEETHGGGRKRAVALGEERKRAVTLGEETKRGGTGEIEKDERDGSGTEPWFLKPAGCSQNRKKSVSVYWKPVGLSLRFKNLRKFVIKNLEFRTRFMMKKLHNNVELCDLQNLSKLPGIEKGKKKKGNGTMRVDSLVELGSWNQLLLS
jgi:hypothetical protein